jgi:hypothetical protein
MLGPAGASVNGEDNHGVDNQPPSGAEGPGPRGHAGARAGGCVSVLGRA